MQESVSRETQNPSHKALLRRNSPAYIRLRITEQYLLLYLLAFIFGIVLCSLLDTASLPAIGRYTDAHFADPFAGCTGLLDGSTVVIDCAGGDIRAMLLILTASFTMFCPLALSLLTIWRGFSLGFTAAYLCTALADGLITLPHSAAAFVGFLGANVFVAAAFVYLSAQAVLFSHQYREICGRPRKILRSPFVWHYLFGYLTMFGFVLIVHLLYCLLSTLLL